MDESFNYDPSLTASPMDGETHMKRCESQFLEKIKELEQDNSRLKNKLKLHDAATLDNFNEQIEGLKALNETKEKTIRNLRKDREQAELLANELAQSQSDTHRELKEKNKRFAY